MCVYEISEIANLVISAVGTVNKIQEVRQAKAQSEYETKELVRQAKKAEDQAGVERQEGIEEARRQKLVSILNMKKEKATFAASNIANSSQTALNILNDEKAVGELNAINTLKEADNRSNSFLSKSDDYYKKASLASYKNKYAYRNMYMNNFLNGSKEFFSTLGGFYEKK